MLGEKGDAALDNDELMEDTIDAIEPHEAGLEVEPKAFAEIN